MPLYVTETRIVNPYIEKCICGGDTKDDVNVPIYGNSNASAYVQCKKCDIKMSVSTNDIGYGETEESIYLRVISKWNATMSFGKKQNERP